MTVIVENQLVTRLPDSVANLYECFPSLKAEASKLVLKSIRTIDNPQKVLYVTQKEYAIVKKDDPNISLVGTDDATTCHIVIMINREESTICLAHIDSASNTEDLTRMVVGAVGSSRIGTDFHLDLHIVGGYADEEQESEKLTFGLLRFFQQLPVNFKLQGCCVGCINTRLNSGINFPIIYGLAVDLPSLNLYPAKFSSEVRGPCLSVRACRMFCSQPSLYRVYHSKDGVIKIKPFNYRFPHQVTEWLRRSDEFILHNFSTSPAVEPQHFAREMRQVFQFVAQNPFPMHSVFKTNQSLKFSLSDQGEWRKL